VTQSVKGFHCSGPSQNHDSVNPLTMHDARQFARLQDTPARIFHRQPEDSAVHDEDAVDVQVDGPVFFLHSGRRMRWIVHSSPGVVRFENRERLAVFIG
jgi:hypothetical protein